jgi:hypothetical protein
MNGFTVRLYHDNSIQTESLAALLLILKHLPADLIHCVSIWTTDKEQQFIICRRIFEFCNPPNMIYIGPNENYLVEQLLKSKGYNMTGGNWVKL